MLAMLSIEIGIMYENK